MPPQTQSRQPRSAAARRAAEQTGDLEPVAQDGPETAVPGPDDAADAADAAEGAVSAEDLELAREEARLAQEERDAMQAELEALRAAAAASPPAADAADDAAVEAPAPARPASVVPRAEPDEDISPQELALLKQWRTARAREIRERIEDAPTTIGTDLDQYTLVHLRGCPRPQRTETYEAVNTVTRQVFTIHRCVECGAHLAIPH